MKTKFIALVSATALAIGSITGCSTTSKPPDDTPAQKRQNLDAAVDAALAQLYAQDPASRELVAKSRGVLVFPSIVTAGFVIGGSYGQGALRVAGKTAQYYKTAAGSVGLLAAGIIIGGGAALLLAPKSGAELRSDVSKRAKQLKSGAQERFARAKEAALESTH